MRDIDRWAKNEFGKQDWWDRTDWWLVIVLLVFVLTIVAFIYSPSVDPPTHMKSSDPYWYSGK